MRKIRHDSLYLILVALLAALVRLDFLIASDWVIDSDEGIVGLMAKHVAEGQPVPIFYYGQHYMGSFEAFLAAGMFKLFGMSAVTLKLVPFLFSIAMVPLMYRLGEQLGGKLAGRVASLLWAFPPSPLVVWSAMARGGFIEVVWLGAFALYLAVRWLQQDKVRFMDLAAAGFVLGFGWWVNNQIVFFMAPIGFMVLCRLLGEQRSRLLLIVKAACAGGLAFIFGGLPFWVYNLANDFASFGIFGRARAEEIPGHIYGLLATALPMLLGAKRFWHERDIVAGASLAVMSFYLAALLFLLFIRARFIARLAFLSVDRRVPVEIYLLFILSAVAAFSLSSFGHLVTAPRYLLPIYVGVFVLIGYLSAVLWKMNRTLSRVVMFVPLLFSSVSSYMDGRALPGQPFVAFNQRAAHDHSELISWLERHNVSFIKTNYWIGYRLAFETGERVRFLMFQEPAQIRMKEYEEAGEPMDDAEIPLVLVPAQADHVRRALRVSGFEFDEARASGYVILSGIRKRWIDFKRADVTNVRPSASQRSEASGLAIDGDTTTRWGSGSPQQPGQWFDLEFGEPAQIRGLNYKFKGWESDFPRGLTVTGYRPDGTEVILLTNQQYQSLRYYSYPSSKWRIEFEPQKLSRVRFTQTGSDPVFDWSIGELSVWE